MMRDKGGDTVEMTRISVIVSVEEREALRELARQELRDPRDQARYIIVQALMGYGFLPPNVFPALREEQQKTAKHC